MWIEINSFFTEVSKMLRVCICDDDSYTRSSLSKMVTTYSFQKDIEFEIKQYDSPSILVNSPGEFDIIFLDIEFGEKQDGIDVAKVLRQKGDNSILIFVTSHANMSIKGYEAEAFRFVVKPLSIQQIFAVLSSCMVKLARNQTIKVKTEDGIELIKTDNIMYILSAARKRFIYFENGNIKSTWQTLKDLYDILPRRQFQYAQKSYVVNIDKVVSISNNIITMKNGVMIPLSRHQKSAFFDSLKCFLEEF